MIILDYILVALILAIALTYLVKAFWPKDKQGGCACSNKHCKVPKPKLEKQENH